MTSSVGLKLAYRLKMAFLNSNCFVEKKLAGHI